MKITDPVSAETLNAFLDHALSDEDRAQVLTALREDKSLADEFTALQQVNEMVSLAYHTVPAAPHDQTIPHQKYLTPLRIAAAIMLLVLGSALGWYLHRPAYSPATLPFTNLSQLDQKFQTDNKILIHINAMDDARITKVLNETEHLLAQAKQRDKPLQLEIVANASALGMLRKGSPYARRIHQIASANSNVSFLACGFAMENARLKEGRDIKLIPDAHKVDAALEQILRRLKAGWLYVRG